MEIVEAIRDDETQIIELYRQCIEDMQLREVFQWNIYYPSNDIVLADINKQTMYVLKDGKSIIGVITLNEDQEPQYKQIDWIDVNGKVLVVHRLAVSPKHQGKGYAKLLMNFAEDFATKRGYSSIRLDAYTGNSQALNLYDKRGYVKRGLTYFTGRDLPFYCYEKIVKD